MQCQKCKKKLASNGSHFLCQGTCQGTFHRSCVKGLAADMKAGRIRIFCNNCEDEESEEEEQEIEGQGFEKILKDIQNKVNSLPGFKNQLNSIITSMAVLSEKYDTILAEHEESKKKICKLEKYVESVNNKCVYLEKCNIALEQKVHDFEQSTRKHNIEIVGIEQMPDENVMEVVKKLGDSLEVNCDDIEWASRRQQRKTSDKPATIVIGFKSTGTESRSSWIANRRKLAKVNSSIITSGTQKNKIYINEDLTKTTRELLWNTKTQLKGIYKYIWVVNGRVLVKKEEGDKSVWVRSESDIRDLLKK